ncbi:pimeloyl-ACP methyl ester carboxylesterase [Asanoa ferruginea]|uniref:Pimeloyl-ACP methyl ester carboxylesterase n=1 Tax=Asanoa ferruginea TaxID=53367 RepID=A0A3D9ZQ88_9ACTN|nr:alpha/beta hydrolase [Asanoa ferruginea]REF99337.1 pimeloyl-ACP methyl ester carboxylesterase [Asanoa ferruginea]GIF45939.1 alpha/beta hydrolase [Asanoa ferruginea]
MAKPTIVLVHGAWADASSWNAVASTLQGQGFTVFAPTNLLRGVTIDAPYVASFLAGRTSGPVVLVGHSYGGFVVTNAATGGGDVRALVYIDAFIPDEGETTFQIIGGSSSALAVPDPTTVFDPVPYPGGPPGDVEAFLKPDAVHNSFAQDLPEADRWLIAAGQRPLTLSANNIPSGAPAWKSLPSWSVIGLQDRIIPADVQRRMCERANATISTAEASHVSMISQPQVTIDAILSAAASIS